MRVKEVQVFLKDRSLSTSGKKANLINRLSKYKQQSEYVSSPVPTSDGITASEPEQVIEKAQEGEQETADEDQPASTSEAQGEVANEVEPEAGLSQENAAVDPEPETAAQLDLDETKEETEA